MYEIWIVCDQEKVEFWRSYHQNRRHCPEIQLADCGPNITMPQDAKFIRTLKVGGDLYSTCKPGLSPEQVHNLKSRIAAVQKNLSNSKFVERAPASVVQAARDKLAELEDLLGDNHEHNLHAR